MDAGEGEASTASSSAFGTFDSLRSLRAGSSPPAEKRWGRRALDVGKRKLLFSGAAARFWKKSSRRAQKSVVSITEETESKDEI